ncbi:multidrug transporter [Oceanobacillus oncorhynchi subsp. incaldanensis]|uniref:EamA-like transporter family protein n=2 Tax=Oceanobacillus TaxID=182709 RepID=A0A0A1MSK7_9BACI|nr:DMT family transporter [Oceanobacillus oncorhynchi]MDM8102618.1 DMT family transporter [Oceanobacillus oncorhynchi]UUI41111.1 DMT family transporter [Oceanobacillus oncorhynchi]GIO21004.1 multidrug transporter [Oceanobacillus oncorhynchi subsp. incaldanensis]CEI82567.1 EamA-like transporter family protein [Oceanobacillus oncorhynchi]
MKQGTINILLVVSIICISLSAIFVKLSDAPSTIMVMYRMFLACLLILPIVYKYRKSFLKIKRKEWAAISFAGIFLAGHFGLWFESLNHTTVASSTLILALQPAIALVGGLVFFKEKIDIRTVAAMGIAFAGVVVVGGGSFGGGSGALLGNILSFLAVVSVVLYLMIGQRNVKSINHWVYSFLVFLVAGITVAVFNLIGGIAFTGYSGNDWMVFLMLAIFPTGAHIIFNLLLNYVNTTTVSMSTLGEPIGASILAVILLNEVLTSVEMIGGVLIIAGIFYFLRLQGGSKQAVPKEPESL